jgi:hypothetical protein
VNLDHGPSTRGRVRRAVAGAVLLLASASCRQATTHAAVELAPAPSPPPAAAPGTTVAPTPVRPGLLVNRPKPFTQDETDRLRRIEGVTRTALIGYGPVYVYGEPIFTATVDPATYRSFTPPDTSGSAPVWKAVMDGKALVSHTVGERDHLPLDAVVPAGWSTVRVAGLATTVPGVDMVVSAAIGEHLGVPFGNGLVVAVAGDPTPVAARVRRALPDATVRPIADSGTVGLRAAPLLPSVVPVNPPATPAGAAESPAKTPATGRG